MITLEELFFKVISHILWTLDQLKSYVLRKLVIVWGRKKVLMYVTRISRDYLTHIGTPNLNQVVNSEMIPRASKGIWLGCAGLKFI